jgi:hypothetical protein
VSLGLLGRQILGGAHDRAGERHVRGAGTGDPEVGDASATLLVEDHVVGLQVAVHDAALVRKSRAAKDLHDDVDRRRRIQGSFVAHDALQRAPGHVLHRDVIGAVPLATVEYADDVLVGERRGARGLAPEALDELLVFGEVMVKHLHGDLTSEQLVLGEIDLRHAPRAEPR